MQGNRSKSRRPSERFIYSFIYFKIDFDNISQCYSFFMAYELVFGIPSKL